MTGRLHRERAIVTGAQGMLGSVLVTTLRGDDRYEVVPLTRQDVDLMDQTAVDRTFCDIEPAVVFHLAAKVAGLGGNLAAGGRMYYENVVINTNVVEAARRAGARKIIAAGTAAIYSDAITLPMREDDLWTGPPHGSERPYGQAKRALLAQLEAYRDQYGLDFAYCVLTNTFGPGDTFDEAHGHVIPSLISKFHRAATDGGDVTVWGTGSAIRDFLYSRDVARAFAGIAEGFSGVVNVASGSTVTIRAVVEMLREISGCSGEVRWDAGKPDGQMLRGYDIARLRMTGFAPRWPLFDALRETYGWYAAQRSTQEC